MSSSSSRRRRRVIELEKRIKIKRENESEREREGPRVYIMKYNIIYKRRTFKKGKKITPANTAQAQPTVSRLAGPVQKKTLRVSLTFTRVSVQSYYILRSHDGYTEYRDDTTR